MSNTKKSFMEKIKMPKLLKFSKLNSAMELGAWFATCMLTYTVIMGSVGYAMDKYNQWKMRREYEKFMESMEEQRKAAETQQVEQEPIEVEVPVVAEEVVAIAAPKKSSKKASK